MYYRMSALVGLTAIAGTLLPAAASWAGGDTGAAPRLSAGSQGSTYELQADSLRVVGCTGEGDGPQCACPILAQPVVGTFGLELVSASDGILEYAVVDVEWNLASFAEDGPPIPLPDSEITGQGSYFIEGQQHRMILNLEVLGEPATFDSGLVDGADLPNITITVSLNQFSNCWDELFAIIAEVPPQPISRPQQLSDSPAKALLTE